MQETIRNLLKNYRLFSAHAVYSKNFIDTRESEETASPSIQQQRIAMLETWLCLLTEDERFVIEKHLIEGIDLPRVQYVYQQRWSELFTCCERTLSNYQASAIRKIEEFCRHDLETFHRLFDKLQDVCDERVRY